MTTPATPPKLGLLGDGQLARMLLKAGSNLGLEMTLLAEDREASAAQVATLVEKGKATDPEALRKLYSRSDTIIFENEFLDTQILASAAIDKKPRFVPSLSVLAELQDKWRQKELFVAAGLATSPFMKIAAPWRASLSDALVRFKGKAVLKWARYGYDGKGVFFLKNNDASLAAAEAFCAEAAQRGGGVYAEEAVDFVCECAIIGVRSINGEFAAYPLVRSEQSSGICHKVLGPFSELSGDNALPETAALYARRFAEHTGLEGAFGMEFFQTQQGALWVNEVAPRVHNTGHYTQDAAECSQFENHLRAVLGMPLGSTKTSELFGMVNLLGPEGMNKEISSRPSFSANEGTHLHWYGKRHVKPGRKLGHINASAKTGEADLISQRLNEAARKWEEEVRSL